MEYTVLTQV